MTKFPVPDEALARHIAVVGETGSGKTHNAKAIVEHVVAEGYRVCILDTIKSDWWGITSSASGQRPGLPFKILGGPRGHVPLHSGAGKAIGHLVGDGKLPLSVIDMADFEPGGPQRFFEHFAQALWKSVRGVVYLVIEEAHELAPKERAGFGSENMAIHWAKKLATGSRTKGIRLIIASQRTQAVHNALLGSCGTLMAHSLSLPADQKPIIDWLNANVRDKALRGTITDDLAFLPTGTAWVCCAKSGFFQKVHFPKITTFDNTATPDKDADDIKVTTAPVNPDELRAIIGDAVKEAEANDPVKLRTEIARLTKELAKAPQAAPAVDLDAARKAMAEGHKHGFAEGFTAGGDAMFNHLWGAVGHFQDGVHDLMDKFRLQKEFPPKPPEVAAPVIAQSPPKPTVGRQPAPATNGHVSPTARKILDTIHGAYPVSLSFPSAALRAGASKRSSQYREYERQVMASGEVETIDGRLRSAAGFDNPVQVHGDPVEGWASRLPPSYAAMLRAIAGAPHGLSKADVAVQAGVSPTSSGLTAGLRELQALALVELTGDIWHLSEGLTP